MSLKCIDVHCTYSAWMIVIIPLAECIKLRIFVNEKNQNILIGNMHTQLILELIYVRVPIKVSFGIVWYCK